MRRVSHGVVHSGVVEEGDAMISFCLSAFCMICTGIGCLVLFDILSFYVLSPFSKAVRSTNCTRKALKDAAVPFGKRWRLLVKEMFIDWWRFSSKGGRFTVGGQVGRHTWGDF